jgi:hypothetical protein
MHIAPFGDDDTEDEDELEPELQWWRELPLVPAVTRLLLRQQTRRQWNPLALDEMVSHFPKLP